nr:M23 family metallopeptidase [Brooklawnia cerclae]
MPANGPYTSPFGYRYNPVYGYSELHDGLDIGASCGTNVYAAASGVVTQAIPAASSGGWGNRVVIDNGWISGVQVSTGYNHMTNYIVSVGQSVSRGQVIGYVGTTGLSTGCHLHFHVWINGSVTDPAPYL